MVKATKTDDSAKVKKKWFDILSPKEFGESSVGETTAHSPDELVGRTVSVNLMNLTGNIKKQNINVKLRITGVKENKHAVTELVEYELMPAYIKRLVRRGRDKLDDSFVVKTSDEKFIRVKPLIITASSTTRTKLTRIRKLTRYFTAKNASEKDCSSFLSEIISGKFQQDLNNFLKREHPLRVVEVRRFIVLNKKPVKVERPVMREEAAKESEDEEEEIEEQKIIESVKQKQEEAQWAEQIDKIEVPPEATTEPSESKPKKSRR